MVCEFIHYHYWLHSSSGSYRKVHSHGDLFATFYRLYCPLFDFDTDKYGLIIIGLPIPNQDLVNNLNAIFINIKVK